MREATDILSNDRQSAVKTGHRDRYIVTSLTIYNPIGPVLARLAQALERPWPTFPGQIIRAFDCTIAYVSPNTWFIAGETALPLEDQAADVLAGIVCSWNDLSSGLTSFVVAGSGARSVLARCCSLDLDARSFAEDTCAYTRFAGIRALLWREGADRFIVNVDVSYKEYIAAWLREAVNRAAAAP